MIVYLVRHGQTETNVHFVPGAARPKSEPLTKLGKQQARSAAGHIAAQDAIPSLIMSSPYTRAHDTATIIGEALHVPVEDDDRLGEYFPGDWDGLGVKEFAELFGQLPVEDRHTFHPPKGESWLDEAKRVDSVIQQSKRDGHRCVVLVSHCDPIRAAVSLLTQEPAEAWLAAIECPPGSVTTLSETAAGWALVI